MKRQMLWAAGLVAVTLLTALPSAAQQGRGGFGRGGFGRGGGNLLSIPEVQKELKLETAQIELLNALNQGGRGNRESFQNMTPEQRREAFAKARAEREKKVAEILDAKQVARLKQLELQQEGLRALGRDAVALQLKLTAEQKQKVEAALTGEREAMRSAFEGFRGNNGQRPTQEQIQAARAKMTEVRSGTDAKLNAVLTDPQKAQWKTMLGAPFTFPERQFRQRGQRPNNA